VSSIRPPAGLDQGNGSPLYLGQTHAAKYTRGPRIIYPGAGVALHIRAAIFAPRSCFQMRNSAVRSIKFAAAPQGSKAACQRVTLTSGSEPQWEHHVRPGAAMVIGTVFVSIHSRTRSKTPGDPNTRCSPPATLINVLGSFASSNSCLAKLIGMTRSASP